MGQVTNSVDIAAVSDKEGPLAPKVTLAASGQGQALVFTGDWTVFTVGAMERPIRALVAQATVSLLDITGVTRLDTAGALVLQRVAFFCRKDDWRTAFRVHDPHHGHLLDQVAASARVDHEPVKGPGPGLRFLNDLGGAIAAEFRNAQALLSFLGQYLVTFARTLIKPASLRMTSLVYHMGEVGLAAVPIVALLSFLIGAVVAYMGAMQLSRFGAQIFVVNLLEVTILREMGVLLTAIVVAGRSGSSFTAQIGAMVANEEVAAMQSMGLNPMAMLVLPRVVALTLMLPALVFLANIMGLLGGGVAISMSMGLTPEAFVVRLQEGINLNNFWVGLIKSPFFAMVIGLVGCFQGFQVTGSAESVGRLTTHSVVQSIFLVIVLNAAFALFFTALGF